MPKDTQYGRTIFIDDFKAAASKAMERIHFSKNAAQSADYDEAWLQRLIMDHPRLLPVDQIEPTFADLVPICKELPTPSGFLDNLLVTPTGNLALVECKLWRNPEARREVIGQIIDYAKDLSAWTYEDLQVAIGRTKILDGSDAGSSRNLYKAISVNGETDEVAFIDAVSRNLRRGRFLLLIVGDGIREGVESMTEFLQQYAGLHFTLAIVEIALFEVPTGGYIAQPRILARTTNIDRGIVTVDDKGHVTIGPAQAAKPSAVAIGTRMTITKEQYLERLEENLPGIKDRLNEFIGKLEMYGVFPNFGVSSMILRWRDDTKEWNLGVIANSGGVYTDNLCGQALDEDILHIAKQYLTNLAALDPDAYVRRGRGETGWGVARAGRTITVGALLADMMREEGWLHAITEFQTAVTRLRQGDWQNADRETRSRVAPIESKIHRETVLELGAEGGSIALFREARAGGDWQFRMATNEMATHDMLSEEDVTGLGPAARETDYVHSFDEGLELLDNYPWFKFVPLQVHAAYRNAVLRAVRERGGPTEETRWKEHLALHRE